MYRCALIIAVILLLSACAGSAPVPEDRFYQLDPVIPETRLSAPVLRGGLEVDDTHADPLRSGRAVLYSEQAQPLQLKRYHYAHWVDQPPRLVQRMLLQYLRDSGIADRVEDAGQRTPAAYRLKTRLLKFEQLRGGASRGVEVALEARLEHMPEGSVIWTSVYARRQPNRGNDIHATAEAMHTAMVELFQALQNDLAGIVVPDR
jgi:ABC-type uncharacterized transport system auxiliary subunit